MKYFTAIYMMPAAKLEEWAKTPEAERKAEEGKYRKEWDLWLSSHSANIKNTIGLGKTKRVDKDGVSDVKNGFMLSSYVEAESHEAAAEMFKGHPHLKLPGATIEVMEANQMGG